MKDQDSRKNDPRHLGTTVILCDQVCTNDACKQFEERTIQVQDGKEKDGDGDIEQMPKRGIRRWYANENASKWVGDE